MSLAKKILVALLALVALALLFTMTLPRHPVMSRTIAIAAPPAVVFAIASDLRRFGEWSPWTATDPAMVITFTGPTDGVGQTMRWDSKVESLGSGAQTITRLEPDKEVGTDVLFGDGREGATLMRLQPKGAGTEVVWEFTTDLGFNPVARVLGLKLDGAVGPDYERGLARLKALAETPPSPSG